MIYEGNTVNIFSLRAVHMHFLRVCFLSPSGVSSISVYFPHLVW